MKQKVALMLLGSANICAAQTTVRPPAVPLVTCDPYFSIWSRGDKLTDVPTTHWTGRTHRLTSLVRIDGKAFRIMGDQPASIPALPQMSVEVRPTQTIYTFAGSGINLNLTFMTPALPGNIDLLSRPVTYLTWTAKAQDGKAHDIQILFSQNAEIAVDEPDQEINWKLLSQGELMGTSVGTTAQPVLKKTGDDRRIDWGHLYAMAPAKEVDAVRINSDLATRFVQIGELPKNETSNFRSSAAKACEAGLLFKLPGVTDTEVSRHVILAYDDEFSIQYFGQNLRPYWRRDGLDIKGLLVSSEDQYAILKVKCDSFDKTLLTDLRKSGGEKYALMCALAYRQCFAGNKIAADANHQPLLFPKENTSNGCIGTVDVIFPMAPQFLLFGPSLTKAMIVSNLDYASSGRWKWPFAPHDLGTYPKANGQVYGGGERTEENQMPVEETGNMLILTAALAEMEGNAKFAEKYWPTLTKWAIFLREKGFDPENQLSTDDFMGHMAHQTNLSVKAILGLASYGKLCENRGLSAQAAKYKVLAQGFAKQWAKEALDGDHYRLAFDQPGTWGQKYNMVWDRILGLDIFPKALKQTEMAFYRKKLSPFGLALDSRQNAHPSKIDWTLWTATLTENDADFQALVDASFRYVNESPQRNGMGDLYDCLSGKHIGMHSRPVVGGFFLKMLYDKKLWQKYAKMDETHSEDWATLPERPVYEVIVPTSEKAAQTWSYRTEKPEGKWFEVAYDASAWKKGPGGFGTRETPGAVVGTVWNTPDIWLRREFTASGPLTNLSLSLYHDEDAEVYINGVLVAKEAGYNNSYDLVSLEKSAVKVGKNVIAVHCHQTTGGQGIDVGIVRLKLK